MILNEQNTQIEPQLTIIENYFEYSVIHPIIPYLTLRDAFKLCRVSQQFYITFTSTDFWQHFLRVHHVHLEPHYVSLSAPYPYSALRVCGMNLAVAAHWRFYLSEGDAGVFLDHSGNKWHGALSGGGSYLDSGCGVDLTGSKANAEIPNSKGGFGMGDEFTVEAWVFPDAFGSSDFQNPIISKHGSGTGWELRLTAKGPSFVYTKAPYEGHTEVKPYTQDYPALYYRSKRPKNSDPNGLKIDDRKWVHIAATHARKGETRVYVNGVCVHQAPSVRPECSYNDEKEFNLQFGRCAGWGDRKFECHLREVRICHSVLEPGQFLPQPYTTL